MNKGRVSLIGAGPGDPGLLTMRAHDLLASADVLLYDALASDPIVTIAPPSCERVFVGKRGGNHAMAQTDIEALMVRYAREGRHVVRLKGGDPFVFGRGAEEAETLAAAGIEFDIVPGISSSVAAPAYAGIPLTHREHNVAFTVMTGHEDPTKALSTIDWSKLADPARTLVILMAMSNLESITRALIEAGLPPSQPAAVIQNGTRPSQRTVTAPLERIASVAAAAGLAAPAIFITGDVVGVRERIAWFDTRPLFGKRVLITRPAHQAHDFARALYARGVEPLLASTIVIGPPDDEHAAHRTIDQLNQYRYLVFTSQNGVDAFFDRLAALDADARYIGSTKVAAIGAKTAQRLRSFGVRADLVPDAFISEEIARALIEATRDGDRILIYRAQEARDVLPRMLEDAGRKPDVVAAYKTTFAQDESLVEKARSADVVTFTSASTVAGFVEMCGGIEIAHAIAGGKVIACIGPVTAEAAAEHGLTADVVADVYTTDGLLDALEAHFSIGR